MMITSSTPLDDNRIVAWSPIERFAFRFVFAYFAMFGCASLLDSGRGPRALAARLFDPPVRWLARDVFGLTGQTAVGGPRWAVAQQIAAFAAAVIIAALWSLGARRVEYTRLRGWTLIVLRYYVAIIMMIYGGFKIVNSQFPPLSLEQLAQPLGSMAPMGLLWAFMGYSNVYAAFTGLGEATGAFLLFFRRTTTAGVLILIAVLSNVALLNYTFDVPVKQLSFNLLLACIVVAATDVKRIVDVLLFNRGTSPAVLSFDLRRRWLYRVRRALKPVVVVGATCIPLAASIVVHRRIVEQPPLYGIYDVEAVIRNGVAVPPLATDGARWRQVILSRSDAMTLRFMNDTVRTMSMSIDSTAHRITLRSRDGSIGSSAFEYEAGRGGLHLRGTTNNDSLDISLARLNHQQAFRLLHHR